MANRMRATGAVLGVAAAFALAGCGGTTMNDSIDSAREQNATFKAALAAVQMQLVDGEWRVDRYGDYPKRCEGGYRFEAVRYVPATSDDGWRIEGGATVGRDRLGEWLTANGFTDVAGQNHPGTDAVTLTASKPDAGLAEISVRFFPGDVMDGISVTALSECFPGDSEALIEQLYPNATIDSTGIVYPTTEHPDAVPLFGEQTTD